MLCWYANYKATRLQRGTMGAVCGFLRVKGMEKEDNLGFQLQVTQLKKITYESTHLYGLLVASELEVKGS